MFTFLILTHFTIVLVGCARLSRLIKSHQVYVPITDISEVHHNDDDEPTPEEDMTTADVRDYINDDFDDDPVRNGSKARKYGDPDDSRDNYVNLPYRPTKQLPVINSSANFMIGTNLQPPQTEVPYSEEPWPTITLSTFDVIVPMIPTLPAKTSPPSWRSHFPTIKSTPSEDLQKRNISRDALKFTTERASKFDVGILDRFIYPEDYVITRLPPDEEVEATGIPTFLSRTTATNARPTITWFSRPTERTKVRVVVKFTNLTHSITPSRTTKGRKRFSVKKRKGKTFKPARPGLRQAAKKAPKWLCYECGLKNDTLGDPWCHNAFDKPDGRNYGMRRNFMKQCPGKEGDKLFGSCFKRYIDVGTMYDERGCRTQEPMKGLSFAAKRYRNLEKILKNEVDKCVVSPYAILTPFSRAVYLFARYHVCVCKGTLCNASLRVTLEWSLIVIVSLFWHVAAIK